MLRLPVESDTRLMVYAFWGDHVAEDLRHEVAHGYLHAVVRNLPLWLDEGLAEYFEVPRGSRGLNKPHVEELRSSLDRGWQPDLRRLESLQSVDQMTQLDYAEAWAWVHYLLETSPEHAEFLRSYLRRRRLQESTRGLAWRGPNRRRDVGAQRTDLYFSLPRSKFGFSMIPKVLPNGSATLATLIPSPTSCSCSRTVAPSAMSRPTSAAASGTPQ